jgi:predicted Zn-dependent peptidase
MLNRTLAPLAHKPGKIEVKQVSSSALKNGIPVYTLKAGSQDITRLEFIFKAGMYYQPNTLIASATNNLLETGTKSYTADEISEGIDFYGSFLELNVEQDHSVVTVYSLNKYLSETLKFVQEVICEPSFPEDEFNLYITNKRQKFQINSQKVSVLARRNFTRALFGDNHPYGVDVQETDFTRVNVNEIRSFYNKHYSPANCTIIASGNVPEDTETLLENYFGAWQGAPKVHLQIDRVMFQKGHELFIQKDDAVQSAIKVGRLLFNKTHPDYCAFQVLNTILGGYFGSRLMANIREDKGYTYGIGSGITNLVHEGYFSISTEVGADVTRSALQEVFFELKKLREEPVGNQELETVRNYILGQFQRSVDGPFALADKYRNIADYGLDYSFYDRYFEIVSSVTPKQLQDLANTYLREEDMLVCVAGKKD